LPPKSLPNSYTHSNNPVLQRPIEPALTFTDDGFKQQIQDETGIKPNWAAESFVDLEEDVRQSLRRIESSPFVTKHESLRGFIFDVATGKLNEVTL
ncbi:carbonic anhydrase, partial [Mycolicibacterium fortuitum]